MQYKQNVVIVGYNKLSDKLLYHFKHKKLEVRLHGVFHDENIIRLNDVPKLGNINSAISYSKQHNINVIYSTISPDENHKIFEMAQEAENNFIRFKYIPDSTNFINKPMHVETKKGFIVLSERPDPLEHIENRAKKRLFDILFSVTVIIFLLSWLVPIIALLIKLDSKGPVFFNQLRSGKNNKPFYCCKFRCLKVNNESHSIQVTANDTRFTRVGKFLKRTNLDELPQFFNVLQSKMSVIGPPPHMLKHTEEWGRSLKGYMSRHYIKPGITGWAQVNGLGGEIKNKQILVSRIEHDIWYLENWNMKLDLKIIGVSILKTFTGDKAAI